MGFSSNLKYMRKKKNISQDKIAELLGYKSFTTVQKWESGISEPSVEKLKILAEYFNVSMDELLNSDLSKNDDQTPTFDRDVFVTNLKRYMSINNITASELCEQLNLRQSSFSDWINKKTYPRIGKIQELADFFGIYKSDLTENKGGINIHKGIKIPVLGKVIAGVPIEAIEEIIDYEEIDADLARTGEYFALQVKGDSMEPRMVEGDVVIVRKQSTCESGDVAIVLVNGDEATVKRVRMLENGIMLIPFNSKYEPWVYDAMQCRDYPVSIIGKVVELRGKF